MPAAPRDVLLKSRREAEVRRAEPEGNEWEAAAN